MFQTISTIILGFLAFVLVLTAFGYEGHKERKYVILKQTLFVAIPVLTSVYILFCLLGAKIHTPFVFIGLGFYYLIEPCLTRSIRTPFGFYLEILLGINLLLIGLLQAKLI